MNKALSVIKKELQNSNLKIKNKKRRRKSKGYSTNPFGLSKKTFYIDSF